MASKGKTPKYFVMTCEGIPDPAGMGDSPDFETGPWMSGGPLDFDVQELLEYTLDPEYPGELKPLYENAVPVMRDDLLEALQEAGVDNLELFRAVIRDEEKGIDYTNYKAFNIVGVVSCADMSKSQRMGTTNSTMIDVDFDSLVIDESKTGGALMFRLAEAVNAIVVHEKVKRNIKKRGIPGMTFYGPGEWTG
jgi:hypothetical protein